ncbi:hypothetical protein B0H13DRAFT_2059570 [Mycena leptocephala]|nr:hypothetical protein B0H13DRAFT_2059570 [Mycena leptocephala]
MADNNAFKLDLLRNRDPRSALGSFDGKVAALAQIGAEHYFITTNVDYVPAVPSLQLPHALFLRSNMRYGTDDPTLWPQQWTPRYCHLPAIAKKGTRPEFDMMWWDPSLEDFVAGSAITRGLGRLKHKCMARFLPPINNLIAQCKKLRQTSRAPISPLFGELIQNILMWTEQLQTLPMPYSKMLFAVTSLQRAFLELDALYNYMTIYKPRIDSYMNGPPANTPVAECVGTFTTVPSVAQQLWSARLPYWFLRPTFVFDTENILAVVPLLEPGFIVPDALGDGAPPIIYSGNSTSDKLTAIHRAATQIPWYRDPFETTDTRSRSISPPLVPQPSAASAVAGSSRQVARSNNQQTRFKPYSSKAPAKGPAKNPPKIERDKFSPLLAEEMPPSIVAWANALAQVDRSVSPITSNLADRRYVLPEPALLVNTASDRRRKFLHHWSLLSDGFMYMLSQPQHAQLLSAQEWRDILEGLMTKRGAANSRTYRRSANLEDRICPALQASNIVWQVAETSFRFEFCSLDRRASKKDRLDEVKACFAGHMLIGVPLGLSKCGWVATAIEERHRYVMRAANLMLDWMTNSARPNIIGPGIAQRLNWSPSEMQALETAVCRYYTQAFWEHFGHAAIVPLRLDHDVEKEEGQL